MRQTSFGFICALGQAPFPNGNIPSTPVLIVDLGLGPWYTYRRNDIKPDGWPAIMEALKDATSITKLNGVVGLEGLFRGGETEVELDGKSLGKDEAAVAVSLLLERSQSTLEKLNLRCRCNPKKHGSKKSNLQ